MKKILSMSLVLLLLFSTTGCITVGNQRSSYQNRTPYKTSGVVEEKSFTVDAFDGISTKGMMDKLVVHVAQGPSDVRIAADSAYFDIITVNATQGLLEIDAQERLVQKVEVWIITPEITKIKCINEIKIDSMGVLQGDRLTIDVAGAIDGNLQLAYDSMAVDISGAGSLALEGTVREATYLSAGASAIEAKQLITKICSIDMSGAGSASVRCDEVLDVDLSGVGVVEYTGDATVSKNVSGLGTVTKIK